MKATCKSTLGVENASQSEAIKEKKRNTNNKHWGVDNFSKSPLFSAFHRKRIFHDGLYFDSNWEVKVYDYLKENHIPFEYSPKISLPYEYDGRTFTYHPDFLVDGIIYEVKGDQFFRINESTGQEEMFNPYRKQEWSDEQYAWVCGKFNAKFQCMIKNNVRILRDADIKNLDVIFNMNNQSTFL